MDLQGKREDPSRPKGKRESGRADDDVLSSFPPYYQAARTHDRTETEIDFPVGLTPQPSIMHHVKGEPDAKSGNDKRYVLVKTLTKRDESVGSR